MRRVSLAGDPQILTNVLVRDDRSRNFLLFLSLPRFRIPTYMETLLCVYT